MFTSLYCKLKGSVETNVFAGRIDKSVFLLKGSKINDDDRLFKERMKNITAWEERDSKIYENAYKEKNKRVSLFNKRRQLSGFL